MTATGPIAADQLSRTLMHEHLSTAFADWQSDPRSVSPPYGERLAVGIDRIHEMQSFGIASMIDPCPIDLGRSPELAAELMTRTGFTIVLATGLYLDNMAGAHWKMMARFGGARYLADAFIREITDGIAGTDVRAGVIKVATGPKRITAYERTVLEAAALASIETDTPITTHTDRGAMGDEQQRMLVSFGVAPHRIIIGHCCGTTDHEYHLTIARGGSYLGFDRFGLESELPDDKRTEALWRLMSAGFGDRVVVSQDTVWCWLGRPAAWPDDANWHVLRFVREIAPRLKELGATDADLDALLLHNPRRYFTGEPL